MAEVLTDTAVVHALLTRRVRVTPLISPSQVGMTIDLRLGTDFKVKRMDRLTHFDPVEFADMHRGDPDAARKYYETIKKLDATSPFVLHPGHPALGCSLEYVRLSKDVGGLLEGRSGWAREGLHVHSTAGFIHPGHDGVIVFELQNQGTHPLPLYPGTRVAQLLLYELDAPTERPYNHEADPGKYVNAVTTSYGRPWEDWEYAALARERSPKGRRRSTLRRT